MSEIKEQIQSQLNEIHSQVDGFIKATTEETEKHGDISKKHAEQLASLESQLVDVNAAMEELSQSTDTIHGVGGAQIKSFGEEVVGHKAYEDYMAGATSRARIDIEMNTTVGSDVIIPPDRRDNIIPGAERTLSVSSVLPQLQTTLQSVEVTRENVFTNNAAETAEAAEKPESDITFDLVTTPIRTIAHHLKVSRQVMEDRPLLVSYINSRLVYGVNLRVDTQLLVGDGTGQNISGMFNTGNFTAFTPTGTDSIVSLRQAKTDVMQADYAATAVILNPADVEAIDLTTTTDGAYVAANPRSQSPAQIWGLPIVETNAMTAGSFLMAAFPIFAGQLNRSDVTVTMSDSDDDNFTKNLITILAERRVGLAIWRPASAVGGALSI